MAVDCAEHLSDKYQMHILGFGKEAVVEELRNRIEILNRRAGYEKALYHGYMTGDELTEFYYRCDIGLSSNVMRENFVNNSFPSKAVTYIAHGLSVVSGYGKSLEMSRLSKYWHFFHEFLPKEVARIIQQVDYRNDIGEKQRLIRQMDQELVAWLKKEIQ